MGVVAGAPKVVLWGSRQRWRAKYKSWKKFWVLDNIWSQDTNPRLVIIRLLINWESNNLLFLSYCYFFFLIHVIECKLQLTEIICGFVLWIRWRKKEGNTTVSSKFQSSDGRTMVQMMENWWLRAGESLSYRGVGGWVRVLISGHWNQCDFCYAGSHLVVYQRNQFKR